MWSRATVTTWRPQWCIAETAAPMSTKRMIAPPWTLPIGLASLGRTTWLMTLREADMGRGSSGAGSPKSRRRYGELGGVGMGPLRNADCGLRIADWRTV